MKKSLHRTIKQFEIETKRVLKFQDNKQVYQELRRIYDYLSAMENTLICIDHEVPIELTQLIVTVECIADLYR